MVSKLSGTTKNLTAGLISDPHKMENLIGMVRTFAPLTSVQTVTKVNTYLPLFEKASTLLGMYSFLSRAQNFRPIEPLNAKNPQDIVSSLMKNGNVPIGKILTQPLIANNMDKIIGSIATNMLKNGGLNNLLKNNGLSEMLDNENLGELFSSLNSTKNPSANNIDLNSLMETFMPIISSMSSSSGHSEDEENNKTKDDTPNRIELMNENNLNDDETKTEYEVSPAVDYDEQYDKYDRYDVKKESYDRNYKKERFDTYEKAVNYNDHKNNFTEIRDVQKPIRIKQRKRR